MKKTLNNPWYITGHKFWVNTLSFAKYVVNHKPKTKAQNYINNLRIGTTNI